MVDSPTARLIDSGSGVYWYLLSSISAPELSDERRNVPSSQMPQAPGYGINRTSGRLLFTMPAKPLHKTQNTKHKNTDRTYIPQVPSKYSMYLLRRTASRPGPITRTRGLVPWCYSWSPACLAGLPGLSLAASLARASLELLDPVNWAGVVERSGAAPLVRDSDARFAAPSNPTLLIPNAASLRSRRQTRGGGLCNLGLSVQLFAPAGYLSTNNQ